MIRKSTVGLFAIFLMVLCACKAPTPEPQLAIDPVKIDRALQALVDEKQVMGVSALIYHNEREIYYGDAGMANKEAVLPWERDTQVTIYSMTKPVTGVTLMSIYEEGLFDLDAPLSDYLPEFKDVRVFAGLDGNGEMVLVPPDRPIKVIDIFRHTSCMGYGWGNDPVSLVMNAADIHNPQKPLSQFSTELAEVPLYCHPGTQWKYSVSVDVQARLAEVVTGQPFETLIRERVLNPLNMTNTSYYVPVGERSKLAYVYAKTDNGDLERVPDENVYSRRTEVPVQTNGGHGLISTIDDYMSFARMLQNEGQLGDVQILKPETIELMTKNHLPDNLVDMDFLPSKGQMGFGLNFAVRIAEPINDQEPYGVVGEFFWDGAPSPFFWVDPENDLTVVFMTQVFPFNRAAQAQFRRAVYDAVEFP